MPGMRLDQLVNSATHRSERETDEFGENESDYSFSDQETNSQLDHTTYEGERRLSDEHGIDRQWQGSQLRAPSAHPPPPVSELMVMLQNQQALLNEVLIGQKAMKERQDKMDTSLVSLRQEVSTNKREFPSSSSSSSDGKRKCIVTRSLSVSPHTCLCSVLSCILIRNIMHALQ